MSLRRITIVGTGYIGTATAIGMGQLGYAVVGFDVDASRISRLRAGIPPYRESSFEHDLPRLVESGRVRFTDDLRAALDGAAVVMIAVGTPPRADGSADLSALDRAIDDVLQHGVAPDTVVAVRSTVPPGTCDALAERIGDAFELLYVPEFLREGTAVHDVLHPDRTVIGAQSERAAAVYARLVEPLEAPVVVTSWKNAELIKGCSNAFLALKISYANETANLCSAVGADARDVLHGVGLDRRIGGAFLQPGIGFGGPCFEKDVRSLSHVAQASGAGGELLEATLRVNDAQPRKIVDLLEAELGGLAGARIGVWGLAFKAGTDDVRSSLALRVIDDLVARGARATVFDPAAKSGLSSTAVRHASSALDAAKADALLILTDWPEFRDVDLGSVAARLRRGVVIDGRNVLEPDVVAAHRLRYRGVGRAADPPSDDARSLRA